MERAIEHSAAASTRPAGLLDRAALLARKERLEAAAAEIGLRISVFADPAAITALDELRRELALIARDP